MTLDQYNQSKELQKEFQAKVIEIIPLPSRASVEISVFQIPLNAPIFKKIKTQALGTSPREFLISKEICSVKIYSVHR